MQASIAAARSISSFVELELSRLQFRHVQDLIDEPEQMGTTARIYCRHNRDSARFAPDQHFGFDDFEKPMTAFKGTQLMAHIGEKIATLARLAGLGHFFRNAVNAFLNGVVTEHAKGATRNPISSEPVVEGNLRVRDRRRGPGHGFP